MQVNGWRVHAHGFWVLDTGTGYW